MPWKGIKDPYAIWLSEILLQQTRVEQGLPYFNKFIEAFPDVESLARASEKQILSMWEGLGYYSRARNMHKAAKLIVQNYDSIFPKEYNAIIQLPGIGPYTAAAISSFAYNQPYPVIDGNVIRVLSRVFGLYEDFSMQKNKKSIDALARNLISNHPPALYNQAIMDFGAIHCTPKIPLCKSCPFKQSCHAFNNHAIDELPVKKKKIKKRVRHLHYFHIINDDDEILMTQRIKKDIWYKLFDLPHIEIEHLMPLSPLEAKDQLQNLLPIHIDGNIQYLHSISHVLTHQKIYGYFYFINYQGKAIEPFHWVGKEQLKRLGKSKLLVNHLSRINQMK